MLSAAKGFFTSGQLDQLWYCRPTSLLEVDMIVNISEANANLSKLIDMAYHGEEIVIAKNNLPCPINGSLNLSLRLILFI
jgi:hypothetical protein